MKPLPSARPHGPCRLLPARFRLSLGAALGLGLLLPSTVSAAEAARRTFNIPAGDAATTLKHLARQASEQLLYSPDDVTGVQTHAVRGEFTPLVALEHMLDQTPLKARQDEGDRDHHEQAVARPAGFAHRTGQPTQDHTTQTQ